MYKIGISGKANTGKNTLGTIIADQLSPSVFDKKIKYMAFADPVKEIVQIMFPNIPYEYLYGVSELRKKEIPGAFKNNQPLTVRQALQDIGTEVGRGYDDQIWLKNFDYRLSNLQGEIVIVTDVRFENEFNHLKNKGFYMIRLYRNNNDTSEHTSETNQSMILDDKFDCVLFNNGSLKDLEAKVASQVIPNLNQ